MFSAGSCFSSEPGAPGRRLLSGCRTRRHAVIAHDRTGSRRCRHRRAALTIADRQRRGRRRRPAAHAGIRNRSLRRGARGGSRAGRRRPADRARVSVPSVSGDFAAARSAAVIRRDSNACSARGRIADWLELLGYDVTLTRNYLFTPPWGGTAPRPGVPSALLRRGWIKPWPAGAYLIKARKRVYTLTPIRPKMRERAQTHRRPGQTHDAAREFLSLRQPLAINARLAPHATDRSRR